MDSSLDDVRITSTAEALLAQATSFVHSSIASLSEDMRTRIRRAALDLARSLETPKDTWVDTLTNGMRGSSLDVAYEAGWLQLLAASSTPLTVDHLARNSNSEPQVVLRYLRHLAAEKLIEENGLWTFSANDKTRMLAEPSGAATFQWNREILGTGAHLVEYFGQHGYREPPNADDIPSVLHFGKPMYKYLAGDASRRQIFEQLMAGQKDATPDWTEVYPCKERLVRTAVAPEVLLVDIAGGVGHDVQHFLSKDFGLPGKVVLQDLDATICDIDEARQKEANAMAYDFFTPQPIKGAANYYMHEILHNWTDDEAVAILKNQVSAMSSDSRFLINDFCLPDTGVQEYPACLDLLMLQMLGGKERSRQQWENVLGRAGLKIVDIFPLDSGKGETLIECALAR